MLDVALHNIRDATTDKHHVVDDYPYGGGAGMVMKPGPIFAAVEAFTLGREQYDDMAAAVFHYGLLTPIRGA